VKKFNFASILSVLLMFTFAISSFGQVPTMDPTVARLLGIVEKQAADNATLNQQLVRALADRSSTPATSVTDIKELLQAERNAERNRILAEQMGRQIQPVVVEHKEGGFWKRTFLPAAVGFGAGLATGYVIGDNHGTSSTMRQMTNFASATRPVQNITLSNTNAPGGNTFSSRTNVGGNNLTSNPIVTSSSNPNLNMNPSLTSMGGSSSASPSSSAMGGNSSANPSMSASGTGGSGGSSSANPIVTANGGQGGGGGLGGSSSSSANPNTTVTGGGASSTSSGGAGGSANGATALAGGGQGGSSNSNSSNLGLGGSSNSNSNA